MANMCRSLAKIAKAYVTFDVDDPDHLNAFKSLVIGENGVIRQHPFLRFNLEDPFNNVRTMMVTKVSEAYLKQHGL